MRLFSSSESRASPTTIKRPLLFLRRPKRSLRRLSHSFETQRNGLVFIYDMAGSSYTNFELDLSKKILNLLKVDLQ